ncbi:MAG: hypothetical protein J5494_08145, partial [Candidatus Methanomethylophilaceae archaeon]|nr:hypothetical protein [Candidatus Methanomethylophilaceae archaeon]
PAIIIISFLSPYIFNVGPNSASDVRFLFLSILLSSLIVVLTSSFSFVFYAFNRMSYLFIAKMMYSVIQVAGVFILFSFGTPSLAEVGLSYLISASVFFVMTYAFAKRIYPVLKIRPADYDGKLFKEMGSLGVWAVALKIGNLLFIQASIVLVNIFAGEEAGGGFAIVSSLVSMIHTATASFTVSIEPSIYKLYAGKDWEGLSSLLRVAVKAIAFLFALPIAFIIVFAPDLITIWVGAENVHLAAILRIALIGDIAMCAMAAVECVPIVMLRIRLATVFTVFMGIVNIAASSVILSFTDLEGTGAICVWSACTIALSLFIISYVGSITDSRLLVPLGEAYVAGIACVIVLAAVSRYVSLDSGWIMFLAGFLAAFLVYILFAVRAFSSKEREIIMMFVPESLKKPISRLLRYRNSFPGRAGPRSALTPAFCREPRT